MIFVSVFSPMPIGHDEKYETIVKLNTNCKKGHKLAECIFCGAKNFRTNFNFVFFGLFWTVLGFKNREKHVGKAHAKPHVHRWLQS